jgi:hypothetical protein
LAGVAWCLAAVGITLEKCLFLSHFRMPACSGTRWHLAPETTGAKLSWHPFRASFSGLLIEKWVFIASPELICKNAA